MFGFHLLFDAKKGSVMLAMESGRCMALTLILWLHPLAANDLTSAKWQRLYQGYFFGFMSVQ